MKTKERPVLVAEESVMQEALHYPQKLMERLVRIAVNVTGAHSGSLMLLNPNTGELEVEAAVNLSAEACRLKLAVGRGVTGWVASSAKPLRVADVRKDRRYVAIHPRVRSELAVPLLRREQVIGILNVDSLECDAFTSRHEKILLRLAGEAARWLELAWEMAQLRSRSQQLETLIEMGKTIVSELGLDQTLQGITRHATNLMKARMGSLMLVDETGQWLKLRAWFGARADFISRSELPVDESLVGVVLRRQRPLAVLNVQESAHDQHTELARRAGLVSLLCVPLVFENRALGVLSVYTAEPHRFSNEEIGLLEAMAGMSAVAIAKARVVERIVQTEERLKASERLSALGWLAAEVAHEIRNPLTVIQMLFHAMLETVALDSRSAKDAELIETKLKQMNRILDQVLTFARSAQPQLEPVWLQEILNDVLLLVRHKLARHGIRVKRRISAEPLRCLVDRAQIEQALLNLILNACQAMPEGGTLTLGGRRLVKDDQAWVEVLVGDRGVGMSARVQQDLFEPFLTHRQDGNGLGLVLVRKTIEAHGGRIMVQSRPGRGTSMRLWLPAHCGRESP